MGCNVCVTGFVNRPLKRTRGIWTILLRARCMCLIFGNKEFLVFLVRNVYVLSHLPKNKTYIQNRSSVLSKNIKWTWLYIAILISLFRFSDPLFKEWNIQKETRPILEFWLDEFVHRNLTGYPNCKTCYNRNIHCLIFSRWSHVVTG